MVQEVILESLMTEKHVVVAPVRSNQLGSRLNSADKLHFASQRRWLIPGVNFVQGRTGFDLLKILVIRHIVGICWEPVDQFLVRHIAELVGEHWVLHFSAILFVGGKLRVTK